MTNFADGEILDNTNIIVAGLLTNLGEIDTAKLINVTGNINNSNLIKNIDTLQTAQNLTNNADGKIQDNTNIIVAGLLTNLGEIDTAKLIDAGNISNSNLIQNIDTIKTAQSLTNFADGEIVDSTNIIVGTTLTNAGLIDAATLVEVTGNITNNGTITNVITLDAKANLNNNTDGELLNNTNIKVAGALTNAGLIDTATLVEVTGNITNNGTITNVITLDAKANLNNSTTGELLNNTNIKVAGTLNNAGRIDTATLVEVTGAITNNGKITNVITLDAKANLNNNIDGELLNNTNIKVAGTLTNAGLIDTATLVEVTGDIENSNLIQNILTLKTNANLNNTQSGGIKNIETLTVGDELTNAGTIDTVTLFNVTDDVTNSGTIKNVITFNAGAKFINTGLVNTATLIDVADDIENSGTLQNILTLITDKTLYNTIADSKIINIGTLTVGENLSNNGQIDTAKVIDVTGNIVNNNLIQNVLDLQTKANFDNTSDGTLKMIGKLTVGNDLVNAGLIDEVANIIVNNNLTNSATAGEITNIGTLTVDKNLVNAGLIDEVTNINVKTDLNNVGKIDTVANINVTGNISNGNLITNVNTLHTDHDLSNGNASGGVLSFNTNITVDGKLTNNANGQILYNGNINAHELTNEGLIDTATYIDVTDKVDNKNLIQNVLKLHGKNLSNAASGRILNSGTIDVDEKLTNAGLIETAMLIDVKGDIENSGNLQNILTLKSKNLKNLNDGIIQTIISINATDNIENNALIKNITNLNAKNLINTGDIDTVILVDVTEKIENKNDGIIHNVKTLKAKNLENTGKITDNKDIEIGVDLTNNASGVIDLFKTLTVERDVFNFGFIDIDHDSAMTVGRNGVNDEQGHIKVNGLFKAKQFTNTGMISGVGTIEVDVINGKGFNNDGIIAPGNSIGTLWINNSFSSNGKFEIEIDTSHYPSQPIAGIHNDLIVVTNGGVATINGGEVIVKSDDPNPRYASDMRYTFLETGAEGDLIVNVDLTVDENGGDIPLFDFTAGHNTKSYWLDVQREYYYGFKNGKKYSDTFNQLAVGTYIDDIGGNPDPVSDFYTVLVELDKLNKDAGIPHRTKISASAKFALDQMGGAIYGTLATSAIQNTTIVNNTLADILRRNSQPEWTPLDYIFEKELQPPQKKLWALAYGLSGDTKFDQNAPGYRQSFAGTLIGMDKTHNRNLRFGAFASLGEGRITSKLLDVSKSNELLIGLYLYRELSTGYIMANGGLGSNTYNTKRNISFVNRKTKNKHDAFVGTAYLEYGLKIEDIYGVLQPFYGLQYVCNEQDAFTEKGAGDLNLVAKSTDGESLRSLLGLRFNSHSILLKKGQLSFYTNSIWMLECLQSYTDFTAAFSNQNFVNLNSRSNFTVRGNDAKRNWAILGIGFNYDRLSCRVFGSYDAFVNTQQVLHSFSAGLTYCW
ncbi:MAG: autotransporter domain-containing protein [Planctomycetaceae bacterium]|nr:autotransporter domain-containing protein [Planctomycetaceae bacterium]